MTLRVYILALVFLGRAAFSLETSWTKLTALEGLCGGYGTYGTAQDASYLYVAGFTTGGVYRTSDYGGSFDSTTLKNGIYAICAGPNGVFASVTDKSTTNKYYSYDNGTTWTASISAGAKQTAVSMVCATNGVVWFGQYPNGDVYKSTDLGVTWSNTADITGATYVESLAEGYTGDIYGGHYIAGILAKTTNQGASWATVFDSAAQSIYGILITNNNIFLGCQALGATFYSSTNMSTFTLRANPHPASLNSCYGVVMYSNEVYALFSDTTYSTNNGVWKTADYGATWDALPKFPERTLCRALALRGDYLFALHGASGAIYRIKLGDSSAPPASVSKKTVPRRIFELVTRGW